MVNITTSCFELPKPRGYVALPKSFLAGLLVFVSAILAGVDVWSGFP